MPAPTEQEIREAVAQIRPRPGANHDAYLRMEEGFNEARCVLDHLYDLDDLRESELGRLNQLTFDATQGIVDEVIDRLVDALVEAGLRFAAEHPDAPRAKDKAA